MKKKLVLLALCAVASGSMLEAWRGYGHGWRGRGWGYGRGWGWGAPAIGVGLTVPIGGGGPKRPAVVQQFKRVNGYYPSSAREFCNWANNYFEPQEAQRVCRQYEDYLNAPRSAPTGAISFGVGGGGYGYGYPYGGWYGGGYRPWW